MQKSIAKMPPRWRIISISGTVRYNSAFNGPPPPKSGIAVLCVSDLDGSQCGHTPHPIPFSNEGTSPGSYQAHYDLLGVVATGVTSVDLSVQWVNGPELAFASDWDNGSGNINLSDIPNSADFSPLGAKGNPWSG